MIEIGEKDYSELTEEEIENELERLINAPSVFYVAMVEDMNSLYFQQHNTINLKK